MLKFEIYINNDKELHEGDDFTDFKTIEDIQEQNDE